MSNLSKRVEKAKKLVWSHSPRNPGHYGTWGSNGDTGEKYYNVDLSHKKETITLPDCKKNIVTLLVTCKQDTGILCNCPGNERHTVCYHGLGAIYESFRKAGKLVSFFETYEGATRMSFGGKITKIASTQGNGFVWAVIKEWPKQKEIKIKSKSILADTYYGASSILDAQTNINLMRGSEDEEGID